MLLLQDGDSSVQIDMNDEAEVLDGKLRITRRSWQESRSEITHIDLGIEGTWYPTKVSEAIEDNGLELCTFGLKMHFRPHGCKSSCH